MAVVLQRSSGYMPSHCHDGAVTSLRLGKLGDGMVTHIAESEASKRTLNAVEDRSVRQIATLFGR